jgi:hypothetical protein
MSEDSVCFCPMCGSPLVEFSVLVGGNSKCKACNWEGKKEELAHVPFSHDFVSQEQMVKDLFNDVRKTLGAHALPIGQLLIKWGFLTNGSPNLKRDLAAYITWGAQAFLQSMVETRAKIEVGPGEPAVGRPMPEEKVDASRKPS